MDVFSEKLCDEKHIAVEDKLENHDKRLSEHSDRIKKLENDGIGIAKDVSRVEESLKRIEDGLIKVTVQLEALKEKPGRRWDGLIDKVITIIAGIVIGKFLR